MNRHVLCLPALAARPALADAAALAALPATSSPASLPRKLSRLSLRRVAAPALLAALLGGCGSSNDSSDSAATPAPAPVPTPTPTPAPPAAPARGSLLSSAPAAVLDAASLDQALAGAGIADLAGASRCGAEFVALRYQSIGPHGEAIELTGAAMLPTGAGCVGPFPVVSYTRGTDLDRSRTMADPTNYENALVAAMLTGQGVVVVATDYLGYAGSTWPRHPYLHADSEASAAIDALRALRGLATARQLALQPAVNLVGYSQGGHASLATQVRLEQLAGEFEVAGGAHLSGPHDLSLTLARAIDAMPLGGLGSTYYIPFAITGLQGVYGNLYTTPADYFREPYATGIESLFPGTAEVTELITGGKLPLLFSSLVTDRFVTDAGNPASTLSVAMQANASYRPAARQPVLLCGGSRDSVVPFENTTTAAAALTAAGTAVTVIDVETVAAWRDHLPSSLAPVELLASYHARDVPPLCLLAARQGLAGLASANPAP